MLPTTRVIIKSNRILNSLAVVFFFIFVIVWYTVRIFFFSKKTRFARVRDSLIFFFQKHINGFIVFFFSQYAFIATNFFYIM